MKRAANVFKLEKKKLERLFASTKQVPNHSYFCRGTLIEALDPRLL
jgi:hypothetical protein